MERIIIDVREPLEYKLGHVKGALNIPQPSCYKGYQKNSKTYQKIPKSSCTA